MANNLKQLGLAAHNYGDQGDSFDFKAADRGDETTSTKGLDRLIAVTQATEFDGGVNITFGDGSVRFADSGHYLLGDGSVRFATDAGAEMQDIEVHSVRHEVVNDSIF